jgi:polysaccharide export outer membrane protein
MVPALSLAAFLISSTGTGVAAPLPGGGGSGGRILEPQPQPLPSERALPAEPLPPAAVDSDLYVLGPGDALGLTFLDPTAAGVGGGFTILPDGTATLALLGSVQLTGLTVGQATRWLTSLYSKYLLRPQLFLTLSGFRPVKVSVIGEVQRPGLYPLTVGSTPVTAIQTAGGITLNSDVRKVMLRRRLPGPDGTQKQTLLDLTQLLTYGNQLQNPLLFDGDTLFIARTEDPLPNEILELAATNLSPPTINVTVTGEVKSPGTLTLPANSSFAQALLRAGGTTEWRANRKSIELLRVNRNGTTTRELFNYKDPNVAISKGFNPPLRDNDIIIVKRSLYGKSVDLINQVLVPIGTVSNLANTYLLWQNINDNDNN